MRFVQLTLVVLIALSTAAAPPRPYHLELEATPEAAFPWLGRFGKVDIHVYPQGVRSEALWLNAFSKNGATAVTVANPLGRMYVDVTVAEIAPMLRKLSGGNTGVEQSVKPALGPTMKGSVKGLVATRHRLMYGPAAWIDVWTTDAIPQNRHMQLLVRNVVSGISPGTAEVASKLPGTPIYVELNFRRFKKVPLVRLTKITWSDAGHEDALTLGKLYVRAGMLEKLLGGN